MGLFRIRRIALAALSCSLIATSCGGDSGVTGRCDSGNVCINSVSAGSVPLDFLQAQSQLTPGESYFTFGLVNKQGGLLTGGSPELWVARNGGARPLGPFRATFHRFTPDPEDKSPRSPLTGFYAARVTIPTPGRWLFAAVARARESEFVGQRTIEVRSGPVPAAIGSKAISVRTPVATSESGKKRICTRPPPDPMHYISLDEALKNGKPTVVNFGTPLLCEAQLCGPVVDEQLIVFEKIGPRRANFIHIERFPPGSDLKPDTHTIPSYWKKWGLQTEPWTLVIDGKGTIRARFEGPVVAALIEDALKPLL